MICLNRFQFLRVLDLVLSYFVFRPDPDILCLIKHLLGQLDTNSVPRGTPRVECQLSHLAETTLKLASFLHISPQDQLLDS